MSRTIPVSTRSGINPIRDNPATQHRIILQPNTDQTGQTLRSGHAVPEDPPHQTGSTGQAENPESTFYKSTHPRAAAALSRK